MAHAPAHYDIVYVSRAPQQSTDPILAEVGPIFGDLSWTRDLYQPSSIEVSASTNELDDDLTLRLRDLITNPTEIWVYRDDTLIVAGALIGGSIDDSTITLSAVGLEVYLRYMFITSDKSYVAVDQATIAKEFVDDWQALDYGNFGIDTSSITTHSVARTIKYKGNEFDNVYDAIQDLGSAEDGFDMWVDPATRELMLDHPSRGSDLSNSVFLERGISNPNIKFSVAPGVVASESFGASKDENDEVITTTQSNTAVRESFGRVGVADTYENGEQAFLDDQAGAALDVRGTMLFQPGPGLIPVDGAHADDFNPGDLVSYLYDAGIGQQQGIYRVKTKKVSVDGGKETIEVEFE